MLFSFISLLESMKFSFRSTRKKKRDTEMAKDRVPYSDSTEMVDRISGLPDELLCHILSFLPTKLAFTTTIISKRWTLLCYSVSVLDFNYRPKKKTTMTCAIASVVLLTLSCSLLFQLTSLSKSFTLCLGLETPSMIVMSSTHG